MKISNDVQAVIVKQEEKNLSFLVLRRFDKEKNEEHFRLVKGGIKKGEDIEDALKREVNEETGIGDILDKKYLLRYSYVGGEVKHEVDVFLVHVNPDSKINVSSEEEGGFTIHEAIWMTIAEAIKELTFKEERDLIARAIEELKSQVL